MMLLVILQTSFAQKLLSVVRVKHFFHWSQYVVNARHGTGSLGHRVNGSFGSSFTSGSPGHRVIILTRCETRVFPVFEKTQDKDIKIYFFEKIRPTVIEILTFDK